MHKIEVAYIVLNYNTYEKTKRCISSCLKQKNVSAKIILVDNNSTDDSFKKLINDFDGKVEFVKNQENYGYAKANNLCVNKCDIENIPYCFILNSDTELVGDLLTKHLLDVFELSEKVSISAPYIYDVTKFGNRLNRNDSRYLSILRTLRILPKIKKIDNSHSMISEAHGSAFIVKTQDFRTVGGLEEAYFMYGEESHMCKKIQQMGKMIVWYQNEKEYVLHHHDTSNQDEDWRSELSGRNRTLEYYEERNKAFVRWTLAFYSACIFLKKKKNKSFFNGIRVAKQLHKERASKEKIYLNAIELRNKKEMGK